MLTCEDMPMLRECKIPTCLNSNVLWPNSALLVRRVVKADEDGVPGFGSGFGLGLGSGFRSGFVIVHTPEVSIRMNSRPEVVASCCASHHLDE